MCGAHTELSSSAKAIVWHPDDNAQPAPSNPNPSEIYRPEVLETIEAKIHEMDSDLRALSLDIHGMSPSNLTFVSGSDIPASSSGNRLQRSVCLTCCDRPLRFLNRSQYSGMPIALIPLSWRSRALKLLGNIVWILLGKRHSLMDLVEGPLD
jgi:hypothetical protein